MLFILRAVILMGTAVSSILFKKKGDSYDYKKISNESPDKLFVQDFNAAPKFLYIRVSRADLLVEVFSEDHWTKPTEAEKKLIEEYDAFHQNDY